MERSSRKHFSIDAGDVGVVATVPNAGYSVATVEGCEGTLEDGQYFIDSRIDEVLTDEVMPGDLRGNDLPKKLKMDTPLYL